LFSFFFFAVACTIRTNIGFNTLYYIVNIVVEKFKKKLHLKTSFV